MTSPTDRFDVASHIEGALPPPLLSSASTMTGRLELCPYGSHALQQGTRRARPLLRLGFSLCRWTHRLRQDLEPCAVVWLRKCPGPFSKSARRNIGTLNALGLFPPPSLARLPILLFSCSPHGLHRRHVIARQVAQRSTDPCRFKLQGLTLSSSYSRR